MWLALVACDAAPAQAAAPDPGGDEHALIQGAPPGKDYGFNDAFKLQGLGSQLFGNMTLAVGGNTARMPMSWWELEPLRDVLNEVVLTEYLLTYELLLAQGVKPLFIVSTAPPWARDEAFRDCGDIHWCRYPPAASMLGEWREFVAELARRFPRATFEIWNEPNYRGEWRSGVDPARYASLLAAADAAVAGVDPGIRVLMGGLGTATKPESLTAPAFLDKAYAASHSIKGHTDALNIHIYPGPDLGANSFMAHLFSGIRAVRAAYGDDAKPIYVGEVGATTSGPSPMDEDEQADTVMRATRRLLTMADVSGVLVSRLSEDAYALSSDTELGLGVMRRTLLGLEPKLAFCALTRATGAMDSRCPPDTRIDEGPPSLGKSSSVSLRFHSPDQVVGFQCALDGAAFTACASPKAYTGLADGEHTVSVRAFDASGRVDPFPARHKFTVDTTPPDTTLSGLTGDTRHTQPVYGFTSTEPGSTFECSLDGAAFAACTDPYRPGTLSEGMHEVRIRALDPAGNPDPTPATAALNVDLTAPETTLGQVPARWERNPTPTVTFAASEAGSSLRCALDSWDFKPCASPLRLGPLADGDHAFRVVAIDRAGNGDPTPAYVNFTVDTTAPTIRVSGGPAGPTTDQRPVFQLEVNEPGARTECAFDADPYRACTGWRYHQPESNLAEGDHTLRTRAIDLAGNVSAVARRDFSVDRTPPRPPAITSGPGWVPDGLTTANPAFKITPHEAGARLICRLDHALFTPCESDHRYAGLSAGRHLLHARAVDHAGNMSDTTTVGFTVDPTVPETTIVRGPGKRTRQRRPVFGFAASKSDAAFVCGIAGKRFRSCDSRHRMKKLKPGRYALKVSAVDKAGNMDPSPAVRRFRVVR